MTSGELVALIVAALGTAGGLAGGWLSLRGKRLELSTGLTKEERVQSSEVGKQRIITEAEATARLWDRISKLETRIDELNTYWQGRVDACDQQNDDLAIANAKLQVQLLEKEWHVDATDKVLKQHTELLAQNKDILTENAELRAQIQLLTSKERKRTTREDQEQR